MAYVITDLCSGVKDKACVAVCPCDCIVEGRFEKEGQVYDQLYIDPGDCIDCGLCEPACPVNAIFADTDVPNRYAPFAEINAQFFTNAARTAMPSTLTIPDRIRDGF